MQNKATIEIKQSEEIMKKKKVMQILTALLMASVLAGCGAKGGEGSEDVNSQGVSQETPAQGDQTEDIFLKDVEVEKYVTLGDYKGLKVNVTTSLEVDMARRDELVEMLYQEALSYSTGVTVEDGITNRAVVGGDTVNINYEGKKDGVAFSGGTAEGAYLVIGSGSFIDGFEAGLVGVMPGTTVDLNLTFPEAYGNAELAGQEVVFTVTVNYIMPEGMHDAIIPATIYLLGVDNINTVEELEQYVYDFLKEDAEEKYRAELENAVLELLMQNSTFEEPPEELVAQYGERFRSNIANNAAMMGMDGDMFLLQYYNYAGGVEQFISEYAKEAVKQDLALQAVANQENLTMDDEELNALILEQAQGYGFTSVEEFIGGASLEAYREDYLLNKAFNFIVDNAETGN